MEKNVIGIYKAPIYKMAKLDDRFLIQFDFWHPTVDTGYFKVMAPFFEDFAEREKGSLLGLHALVAISGDDLSIAIERTKKMREHFEKFPEEWSEDLGLRTDQGQPERRIYVPLQKKRLLILVRMLRLMFSVAQKNQYCVVCGKGVFCIPLLDLKFPEGTEIYS